MPKPIPFTRHPLFLTIGLTVLIATAVASLPGVVHAEKPLSGTRQANAKITSFDIPAAPLSQVLSQFAGAAGVALSFDASQFNNLGSPGLQGNYSVEEGFATLLAGTGTTAVRQANGDYVLQSAGGMTLPPVKVSAEEIRSSNLPPEYAGGKVARGGRVGMLGNQDVFDTPYSITSYTSQLLEDQQARTVADVVFNDSSAYLINAYNGGGETIAIRGFNAGGNNGALYDGLPGLAHRRFSSVEILERAEVFKGANTLLTGTTGAVGGVVNLVPKRPLEESSTRLTTSYEAQSRAGIHADISRRLGAEKQFGVRFNGIVRDGEGSLENNDEELADLSLALQYQGEKLTLNAIVDSSDKTSEAGNQLFFGVGGVPKAPNTGDAVQQPWETREDEFSRGLISIDYELTTDWALHAAYGATDFEGSFIRTTGGNLDAAGNFNQSARTQRDAVDSRTARLGLNGQFRTGSISHDVAIDALQADDESGSVRGDDTSGYSVVSNIYTPVFVANPNFAPAPRRVPKTSASNISSVALADTLGFYDDRVLLTVGFRRQQVESENFNATTGVQTSHYDESATTPTVGVVFKPKADLSLYGNYIEALEQGPVAPTGTDNAGEAFPPSDTQQMEFGVKWDTGDLGLTAAMFQIDRPNGITNSDNRFDIDGEQSNQGIELSAFGKLTPQLQLLTGITYMDSELTKTENGINEGNTGVGVPELSAVLGIEWEPAGLDGLALNGRANYTGSQYVTTDNTLEIPSYALYSVGARYTKTLGGKEVTFRANIDNLLGEDYWTTFAGVGGILYYGAPRQLNLSATIDF